MTVRLPAVRPGQFGRHIRGEIDKWAKVIKAANVQVE